MDPSTEPNLSEITEEAFGDIITTNERHLLHRLLRQKVPIEDAKDIIQETYIKFLKNYRKEKGSAQSLLFKIAHDFAVDFFRGNARKMISIDDGYSDQNTSDNDCDNILEIQDPKRVDPTETFLKQEEQTEKIINAINLLPKRFKAVATLRYVNGFKYKKIADLLNKAVGTVKSYGSQATHLMENTLSEYAVEKE